MVPLLLASTCPTANSQHKTNEKDTNGKNILRYNETALDIVAGYRVETGLSKTVGILSMIDM